MANGTPPTPIDVIQKIANTDLGAFNGILNSKKLGITFIGFVTFISVAASLNIPAVWCCAFFASAIVIGCYVLGQGNVDAAAINATPTALTPPTTTTASVSTAAKPS